MHTIQLASLDMTLLAVVILSNYCSEMFHLYCLVINTYCEQPPLTLHSKVCPATTRTAEDAVLPSDALKSLQHIWVGCFHSQQQHPSLSQGYQLVVKALKGWKCLENVSLNPAPAITWDQHILEHKYCSYYTSDQGVQRYPMRRSQSGLPGICLILHVPLLDFITPLQSSTDLLWEHFLINHLYKNL